MPALASGVTDHIWSLDEWLGDRRTPAAFSTPTRGYGRPSTLPLFAPSEASAGTSTRSMARKEAPIASTMEGGITSHFFTAEKCIPYFSKLYRFVFQQVARMRCGKRSRRVNTLSHGPVLS
jgi:hypothetical protein